MVPPWTLSPCFVPSAGHAVVCVKLRLDVADASQQFSKHRFPVTAVTGLDTSHPLYCVAVHLHCAVAMRTKGLKTEKKEGWTLTKQTDQHGDVGAESRTLQNPKQIHTIPKRVSAPQQCCCNQPWAQTWRRLCLEPRGKIKYIFKKINIWCLIIQPSNEKQVMMT